VTEAYFRSNPSAWVWIAGVTALAGAGAYVWFSRQAADAAALAQAEAAEKPKRSIIAKGQVGQTLKSVKLKDMKAAPLKMSQQQVDLQKKVATSLFKPKTDAPTTT